jgi:hypothetical protein
MCKKLINSFYLLLLFLGTSSVASSSETFQFPLYARGVSALKDLAKKNQLEYAVYYQSIEYKKDAEFLIINHNIGSGFSRFYVYVYACDKRRCDILATCSSGKEGLIGEISPDEKELILKSEKGVVYLQMPFNFPQPLKEN